MGRRTDLVKQKQIEESENCPVKRRKTTFWLLWILRNAKIFSIILVCSLYALEPRAQPLNLRTSVVIPCHPDHFVLLEPLLEQYSMQSVLPDEIVVSLSEAHKVLCTTLEQKTWPFTFRLLKHAQKYPPGKNRNEACANATGELIICQDADDLPHPQRVEIIRYLFSHYQIEHLLHRWAPSGTSVQLHNVQEASAACRTFRIYEQIDVPEVHNGSVAFLRTLFDKLHWTPLNGIHEDVLFNRIAYVFCAHKAVLAWPLLVYRGEFSTFDLDGSKAQTRQGSQLLP